jgi:hypothetical protein
MKPEMQIEILTFEGCPNAQITRERVARALQLESVRASVKEIEVSSVELAQSMHFLGSPSVRVDGHDVEPGADERRDYGLMCRTYGKNELSGEAPSLAMVREAIQARRNVRVQLGEPNKGPAT